ncbi:MerR family transcriptional regulator [Streptomyces spectabilis]|uniref:DNA-binding transcriptional MerR regulator n=1 Tax=Streptomyces spectabilis TaxID=68270 RepID=A0A5P2XAY9_STRST|nr:MerR family transcriptional regulator [Streptomyces spectabilis]MBB5103047.1 DNA-binding transcriptional MerR regulator [Streptomyces spectabilis]MCI3902242.1 MerR family transcriptional regulator [Streptomyces spectabilis]QEV59612.1 MerR family transcriptional regulator [Streptomyces spectabilis]GGV15092.1 MerR family transcriptional regulator [Streptomyces spectabilis]
MRIGEIAAAVGLTTRAIRHYHHLGLLPEPVRRPNGYRSYGLREAIVLARIKRLTELGLGLDEVRDVLADDAGRELTEVLAELDEDLARQEEAIRERRTRLAELLQMSREGLLPGDGPVSPGLAELLTRLCPADSATAAKDLEHLALFDAVAEAGLRERLYETLREVADDPGLTARLRQVYARLDELADAPVDDPRVAPLGEELAGLVPDNILAVLVDGGEDREEARTGPAAKGGARLGTAFGDAFLDDFAPAQAAAVRHMLKLLTGTTQWSP